MRETNVRELQEAGIVAEKHKMNEHDMKLVNSLTAAEVRTLIRIKNKLGVELLKKTAKGNKFPHPMSIGF